MICTQQIMDKRIIKFINRHHVLTIASTYKDVPWCANCFYVFMEDENSFVFTTDDDTRHGKEFETNPIVAGSVVLETNHKMRSLLETLQFQQHKTYRLYSYEFE